MIMYKQILEYMITISRTQSSSRRTSILISMPPYDTSGRPTGQLLHITRYQIKNYNTKINIIFRFYLRSISQIIYNYIYTHTHTTVLSSTILDFNLKTRGKPALFRLNEGSRWFKSIFHLIPLNPLNHCVFLINQLCL